MPLDEVRGWWRYHHLFAELLRARLQQTRPERLPALHRNAATWCQQHGLADEAMRHALAAGDAAWAARLVEEHVQARFQRSEGVTVNRWLKALPAELVSSRPRLLVASAVWAVVGGRIEQVEPLLRAAEHALATLAGEAPEPSAARTPSGLANVPAMIPMLRAELARERGDAERTIQFGRQGLAHADADDRYLRYLGRWHLAAGTLLQGRAGDAEAALAELAADPWAAGADRYFAVRARYTLGRSQRAQGRLGAALRSCQQAFELAAEPAGRPPMPAAGVAHVGLAEVLYERGELDAALQHASEGVGLCRQLAYPLPLVAGLAVLAWTRQAEGDRAGAVEAMREAERVQVSPAVVVLFNPAPVLWARLALAQGEVAEAAHWVNQRGLAPDDQPGYPREGEYLILARVLLAQHAPDRALGLLERMRALAVAQGRTGSVIEVRAVQALALDAVGDEAGALAALAEALALGGPAGYLRVFVDEGAPMARLFGMLATALATGQAVAAHVAPAYLRRLLAAFDQAGVAVPPGLAVPLSRRELEVLALLVAGTPNQAIAEELVISLHTVKRHVTHIFDKLGATNRTQAVTRARQLGLIR